MFTRSHFSTLLIAAVFSSGVATANAADHAGGQHPAVTVQARKSVIDPNLFIVAPPASTTWAHAHANQEHPAVRVARMASGSSAIDGNTFTVQPPASVTWTVVPPQATAALVAQAR